MNLKSLVIAVVVIGIASGTALAQSSDPLIGTWRLNVEKSKNMRFKSGTSTIERAGDGVKFTVNLVGADGTAHDWAFTAKYDGKDNPVTGNSPFGDTVALTRVDPQTTRITVKQGGKEMATQTINVSTDGKTRTTTTKGTDAKGQKIDSVSFYEKQ
jgi:hypothetical protein